MPARGSKAERISGDKRVPRRETSKALILGKSHPADGVATETLRRNAPSESGSAAEIRKSEGSEPHPMASSFKRSSFRALPHSMARK